MPPFPDLREPLSAPAVRLRPAAERDIPEILIAHEDDPQLHVRLGVRRPPSGAELGRRMEQVPELAAGSAAWLTILDPDSDECRGQIDVHTVDWDHARAQLSIWVVPQHRGRGLAREALRLAGRWLLEECALERVGLETEPDNAPLRRAAAAAGFREEGLLRAYLRERGGRVDVIVGSLVRRDLAEGEEAA